MANMTKAQASQDRINSLLNAQDNIVDAPDCQEKKSFINEISFNNVGFSYQHQEVLSGVNWKVKKGQLVAIVGESGSGKSTLMDLLQRFYDVGEGQIEIDGVDLRKLRITDLRSLIGVVSQESILFNMTAAQNIAFGDENPDKQRIIDAAKVANAYDFITALDNGFETFLGERGNTLSGGQKQRIAIARAIYKNPDILILDEATSALDTESESLVQQALEHLMQDRTSFVIAHRLSTVKNADEIIVLSKGTIIERGKHQDLLALSGHYKRLCDLQGLS
jgi:ABC-type multidrug transport system fused ATPase/permease subunit